MQMDLGTTIYNRIQRIYKTPAYAEFDLRVARFSQTGAGVI